MLQQDTACTKIAYMVSFFYPLIPIHCKFESMPMLAIEKLFYCVDFHKALHPLLNTLKMPRDKRTKRDLHALNEDGMVLCNPLDKEAALRAQTEGIATDDWEKVTCRKCLSLLYKRNKAMREQRGHS